MTVFDKKALSKEILANAKLEGFCSAKIVLPDANPQLPERLSEYLVNGWHGQMSWLQERSWMRSNPKNLWPEVKSIVVVAQSYSPDHDPLSGLKYKSLGNISVYAHGHDYHDVLKKRLKRLGGWLVNKTECEIKVFVDILPKAKINERTKPNGKEIKSNSVYGKQLEHLVTCAKECMEYKKYVVIAGDFNCVQSTVKTYIETLIDPAVLECSFSDPKVTVNKTRAQTI